MLRYIAQQILFHTVRPYMRRELPGWGRFGPVLDHDWLWRDTAIKTVCGKLHGFTMEVDLSNWSDRSTYFLGRWYVLEIQLFLRDVVRPGQLVVDIGANRGMFALNAAAAVGPHGRVLCFEPNPACCHALERLTAINSIDNIEIAKLGLGKEEAELFLSIPKIADGEATFGASRYKSNEIEQVKCAVRRGDDVLANETPNLIKIDVEGFELAVLEGLHQTLERCKPVIITEVIAEHLEACGASIHQLTAFMASLGYAGQRLSLSKDKTWILMPFDHLSGECDVVWMPSDCTHLPGSSAI